MIRSFIPFSSLNSNSINGSIKKNNIDSTKVGINNDKESSSSCCSSSNNDLQTKKYTLKEVSAHTSTDDLWMIIRHKVYNVTKFVADHPGGAEVLFDCAGIDATSSFEDVGHSNDALDMLKGCLLGELTDEHKEFLDNINNNLLLRESQRPSSSSSSSISGKKKKKNSNLKNSIKNNYNTNIDSDNELANEHHEKNFIYDSRFTRHSEHHYNMIERLIDKFPLSILFCIAVLALMSYLYLQSMKWNY